MSFNDVLPLGTHVTVKVNGINQTKCSCYLKEDRRLGVIVCLVLSRPLSWIEDLDTRLTVTNDTTTRQIPELPTRHITVSRA